MISLEMGGCNTKKGRKEVSKHAAACNVPRRVGDVFEVWQHAAFRFGYFPHLA